MLIELREGERGGKWVERERGGGRVEGGREKRDRSGGWRREREEGRSGGRERRWEGTVEGGSSWVLN
jgi:hypothetical protein